MTDHPTRAEVNTRVDARLVARGIEVAGAEQAENGVTSGRRATNTPAQGESIQTAVHGAEISDNSGAICGDIWVSDYGEVTTCTREPGHKNQHDDAEPGDADEDVRVWA